MTQRFWNLLALCALAVMICPVSVHAGDVQGHLVIIGGGDRTDEIMHRFVELAGGPGKANIIVIPLAGGDPEESGRDLTAELHGLGVKNAQWILFSRAEAMQESTAAKLNGATGVFFTGGDQVRITRVIVGTPVQQKLFALYRGGAVIGGTSAGAAIMSNVMITGDELINKDTNNIFVSIQKGNVQTIEGVGFLDKVIIDQHFVKRKRLNRLISVVLEHPELPGIGIDESTALIVNPGGEGEVLGEGTVVVFDARGATDIHTDKHGSLAARNIATHIFSTGERFDMKTLTVRHSPDRK
jgi:cyanophycinase